MKPISVALHKRWTRANKATACRLYTLFYCTESNKQGEAAFTLRELVGLVSFGQSCFGPICYSQQRPYCHHTAGQFFHCCAQAVHVLSFGSAASHRSRNP